MILNFHRKIVRTKKYILNAKDSKAELVYLGCNCGLAYNDVNEGNVENCEFDYFISGGSNGGTGTSVVNATGCKFGIYQTNNRGYINDLEKATFTDCEIEHLFIAGDSTDSTVTGVTNKVEEIDVLGSSNVVFYVGTQGGQLIASHDALDELVDRIIVDRNTTYTFGDENGASLFGDMIRIK